MVHSTTYSWTRALTFCLLRLLFSFCFAVSNGSQHVEITTRLLFDAFGGASLSTDSLLTRALVTCDFVCPRQLAMLLSSIQSVIHLHPQHADLLLTAYILSMLTLLLTAYIHGMLISLLKSTLSACLVLVFQP